MASIIATICSSVRFRSVSAPDGQEAMQVPHPSQRASDTSAIFSAFRLSASYGHRGTQMLHPLHNSPTTRATVGSRSSVGLERRSSALPAAPLACATVSGISLGDCPAPARKIPAVGLSSGRSLGCASEKKPFASSEALSLLATRGILSSGPSRPQVLLNRR